MRNVLLAFLALVEARAKFEVNKDASFSVVGEAGFRVDSGTYMLNRNGKTYLTSDGSLKVKYVGTNAGYDNTGHYEESNYEMTTADKDVGMHAFIRIYHNLEFAIFRQHFFPVWDGMSVGDADKVSTSFPSVKVPEKSDAFYINPAGDMAGDGARKGAWDQKNITNMEGGVRGGPFFIFDKTNMTIGHAGQLIAISAFSKFTAHTAEPSTKLNEIWFGLPGTVDSLPKGGYDIQTIISYSDLGFYEGVQKWGNALRRHYGKGLHRRESDDTVNYLGYWTDNGAYYYYNTEPNKTYTETMLDIYDEIRFGQISAPFRSWNYDSWWYYKCDGDHKGAVKNWTAMPEVFPNGMSEIYEKTSMPVVAHNRWWCNETDYAQRNGGMYHFLYDDESGTAVPQDDIFWEDLFRNSSAWGLRVYLQDWLDVETYRMSLFEEDLSVERNWLMQMGQGAARNDINILYCMSLSRHMLQSVEIQNVVSIRASGDYQPGNGQWDIGLSGIWTFALGLAPFKDTFWTTEMEPGSNYGNKTENHPDLEAAMATLSTGIVGISDEVGKTNMKLVSKSIMADGRILKPSRPLGVPDFLIWELDTTLYLNGTSEFESWSEVSGIRFGIILGWNPGKPDKAPRKHHIQNYAFAKNQMAESFMTTIVRTKNGEDSYEHKRWSKNAPLVTSAFQDVDKDEGILLVMYESPIWKLGKQEVSFAGELGKWTMVSPERFTGIDLNSDRVYVQMQGVPNELVEMRFVIQAAEDEKPQLLDQSCVIPDSGRTSIVLILAEEDKGLPKVYCQDM